MRKTNGGEGIAVKKNNCGLKDGGGGGEKEERKDSCEVSFQPCGDVLLVGAGAWTPHAKRLRSLIHQLH